MKFKGFKNGKFANVVCVWVGKAYYYVLKWRYFFIIYFFFFKWLYVLALLGKNPVRFDQQRNFELSFCLILCLQLITLISPLIILNIMRKRKRYNCLVFIGLLTEFLVAKCNDCQIEMMGSFRIDSLLV